MEVDQSLYCSRVIDAVMSIKLFVIKLINDAMLKYKLMTEAFTRLGYRGNVY